MTVRPRSGTVTWATKALTLGQDRTRPNKARRACDDNARADPDYESEVFVFERSVAVTRGWKWTDNASSKISLAPWRSSSARADLVAQDETEKRREALLSAGSLRAQVAGGMGAACEMG